MDSKAIAIDFFRAFRVLRGRYEVAQPIYCFMQSPWCHGLVKGIGKG